MSKLPGDSGVPPSARSSHPSSQSSEPVEPAVDPDPDDELDGDVIELVLRELDGRGGDGTDPESSGASIYSLGLSPNDREAAEIYDYEGDGHHGTEAPVDADVPSVAAQRSAGEQRGDATPATSEAGNDPKQPEAGAADRVSANERNGRSPGSLASVDSAGSIAATRSAGSIASAWSAGSIASAWSAGSIASALSAGSIASLISVGSLGSILSIGSSGSILSIGSRNSILSIGAEDAFLTIGRGRNARSFGGA